MARTLIGQLLLKLQDNASGEAKAAATKIGAAFKAIENDGKRLGAARWSSQFQASLDRLKLAPRDLRSVQSAWSGLVGHIERQSLPKALARQEISSWRANTLAHLASVRAALETNERKAAAMQRALRPVARAGLYAAGGYAGAYGGGLALRAAGVASGEREREYFRQENAGLSSAERLRIATRALDLSRQFPSVSGTQGMEMFRTARAMMGTVDRADAIMPALFKGLVSLQTAKGVQAGTDEMARLLKAIDNLGKNSAGPLGIADTQAIIEGMVKAAQIEGADLDTGKLFDFARRAKIAGPGLSTDFIMSAAPAFMQDMTAEGFGTALSSAYQAFVIGSNAVASKANIAEQRRLGLRTGDGKGELVGDALFGENPYLWTKRFLVPALEKAGVDITNEVEVAKAVAKLSRNTVATGMITRMITQQEQTDRLLDLYAQSRGFETAEEGRTRDPFVAAAGFRKAFANLSAALGESVTPAVLIAMNGVTDFVNRLAAAVQSNPEFGMTAGGAAMAAAGGAAFMFGRSVYALMTAGTNLNVAALALQRAAVMQAGGGLVGDAGGLARKWTWGGALAAIASRIPAIAAGATVAGGTAYFVRETSASAARENRKPAARTYDQGALQNRDNWHRQFGGVHFEGGRHRAMLGAGPAPGGAPATDFSSAESAARAAGQRMQEALNVQGKASFDSSALDVAIGKARTLLGLLSQARGAQSGVGAGEPYNDEWAFP